MKGELNSTTGGVAHKLEDILYFNDNKNKVILTVGNLGFKGDEKRELRDSF